MQRYVGTKIIIAEPMTLSEWARHAGKDISAPDAPGYLVEYDDGYQSWSPKDVFEEAYRRADALPFGLALEAVKKGRKAARAGWNSKGMWIELQRPDEHSKMTLPYIYMKTAAGDYAPFTPTQCDVLADDWMLVE
jgi:hypothetical protein